MMSAKIARMKKKSINISPIIPLFDSRIRLKVVFKEFRLEPIIPMINPDGVELEYNRENANGIDIESNWNTYPHQPEVQALRQDHAPAGGQGHRI